jgi:glutathione synthase/RimK-type ligase-like ATP-grasp enzyme
LISSDPTVLGVFTTPEYLGLATLLRLHLSGTDLAPHCQSMLQRAAEDPNDACSLMDAAIILQFRGSPDIALNLQQEALKVQRHYRLPAQQPIKLRLLALMAPGEIMANVPIECLLENSDVELNIYYATGGEVNQSEIPDHDVLFVAIGESEANRPILASWLPLLADWSRPVINNPFHIMRLARDSASRLLHSLPGIAMPPTLRIGRAELQRIAQGGSADGVEFPLIVRPLDSHAGHDLNKIDTPEELSEKLSSMPGEEFFISTFIDYRSKDGLFRKYRVILIDGQAFACHMGISSHWMIHYLNAGMAESPEKRAEEAYFMANFEREFAVRHEAALSEINRCIGLDYLGIDCAETQDGRLLIFEVDHAMVVHAMDSVDVFPYKLAPMQKLFAAFREMLIKVAERMTQVSP